MKDKKILIVGAGGASRALAVELISEPIKSLNITNRSFEKAEKVVKTVKSVRQTDKINAVEKEHIEYAEYDFVINATSLGMKSDDPLPFPIISLRPDCVVVSRQSSISSLKIGSLSQGTFSPLRLCDGILLLKPPRI